jgi:hypothetical protein
MEQQTSFGIYILRQGSEREFVPVPRFFFDLTNGHRIPDHTGLDCDDEVRAKQIADSIAADIACEIAETPGDWLTVRTEEGNDIYQAKGRNKKKNSGWLVVLASSRSIGAMKTGSGVSPHKRLGQVISAMLPFCEGSACWPPISDYEIENNNVSICLSNARRSHAG